MRKTLSKTIAMRVKAIATEQKMDSIPLRQQESIGRLLMDIGVSWSV
jgi:hypothetical protein